MQDLGSMNLATDRMLDIQCRQGIVDMEGAIDGAARAARSNSKMLHRL